MKKAAKTLGCMLVGLALCGKAGAIATDGAANPYTGIVDRNVFGLKDPPPPPPPPGNDKPAGPPVFLTGITTIFGTKRALLSLTLPGKAPEGPKVSSPILSEGQREGEIEVLQIDEKAGMVRVSSYGVITNLTFDKNGPKSSTPGTGGPAPVAAAGNPMHSNPFSAAPRPGQTTIPTTSRNIRLGNPAAPNEGGAPPNNNPFVPSPNGASANANGNGLSFGYGNANPNGQAQQQAQSQFTPSQQAILMELEHEKAVKENDPRAAIFPPTPLNPTRNLAQPNQQKPPGTF